MANQKDAQTDIYTGELITDFKNVNINEFSGAARLFYDDTDRGIIADKLPSDVSALVLDEYLDIPLILTSIQAQMADFHKIDAYIGNLYSAYYFGKSPVIFNCTATILNTLGPSSTSSSSIPKVAADGSESILKTGNRFQHFSTLYDNLLRISKAAEYRVAPYLSFTGCDIHGTFLGYTKSIQSMNEDAIPITFQFLALEIKYNNADNVNGCTALDINFISDDSSTALDTMII